MKRLILVISVIIIIASLLAGCSSNSNTTTSKYQLRQPHQLLNLLRLQQCKWQWLIDFNPYAYLECKRQLHRVELMY